MLTCPTCKVPLDKRVSREGIFYSCGRCGGRAVTLAVLRKAASPDFLKRLWNQAHYQAQPHGKVCPGCGSKMAVAAFPLADGPLELEVCTHCQFVWMDPHQQERIPTLMPSTAGGGAAGSLAAHPDARRYTPAAQAARERFAIERVKEMARHSAEEGDENALTWQYVPAMLGLPVELTSPAMTRRPLLTWGLTAMMGIIFYMQWSAGALDDAAQQWGFIPAQWSRYGGLTMLTCFFIHGSIWHLVSNAYFLVIFGDHVEDRLGPVKYLLLLAGATLAGSALHGALDPRGDLPAIGASGGISGVLAYYATVFPKTKIGFLIFRFFGPWLRLPAYVWLLLFVVFQLAGAAAQVAGLSNVSHLAHLGGLAVGVAAGLWTRAGHAEKGY